MVSDNVESGFCLFVRAPAPYAMASGVLAMDERRALYRWRVGSLNLIGYVICVIAVGYGIIRAALPASASTGVFVLAPAAGVMTVSALTAFGVRLGLPLIWVPALWLGLMMAGALLPLERPRTVGQEHRRLRPIAGFVFGLDLWGVLPSRSTKRRNSTA